MRSEHAQRYIDAFEDLTPATLQRLQDCFAEQAYFADPFNEVRGKAAIQRIFEHMFASCEQPRFEVVESSGDDRLVYLRWNFSFGAESARKTVEGVSRVRFDAAGLVVDHRDYWDPASQLYETIPILKRLFRALRKRLAAPQAAPSESNKHTSVNPQRNQT